MGKGTIRKARTVFFAKQLQELEVEINKITSMFYQLIEDQYANLDRISIPFLKEMEEERILESAGRFNDTVVEHSKILLNELESFVKSDDFDRLLEALEKQAKIISGYTIEQKRKFESDILPEIEKKIKNHYERLKKIYNQEEIKKLEKELNELKYSLDINTPAKQ